MASDITKSFSFLRLPNEMQTRIILNLVPDSTTTVHSLLLTCRSLYQLALPLSVHTFINWGYAFDADDPHGYARSRSLNLLFLRYITIVKPELARYVKTIILGDFSTHESDEWPLFKEVGPRPDELSVFHKLIERTYPLDGGIDNETPRMEWLEDLKEGAEDAEIALLLVTCPNIEQLIFGEPYNARNIERLLDRISGQHESPSESFCPLGNLKVAYQESTERKFGYLGFYKSAAKLFKLPRIRSYECILPNGSDNCATVLESIPRRSSSIDEIILRGGTFSPRALSCLIGACKALRSFEYLHGGIHMYDEEVLPGDVLDSLLPHAESLEYLHVNFEGTDKPNEGREGKAIMGMGLKNMAALRQLVMGMQDLAGLGNSLDGQQHQTTQAEKAPSLVQCLPQNLEHFEIHGCDKSILPQIQQLLDAVTTGERFQKLRRVRLLFRPENVGREDVQLNYPKDVVDLDLIFQSEENRQFDLVRSSRLDGVWLSNFCTRIYSRNSRQRWLRYRGGEQARATVKSGVLEVPLV